MASSVHDDTSQEKSKTKTILLVEDEAVIAMEEKGILKKNGFDVITAYDADEAAAAVKSRSIDLILMDIDLGKNSKDGTEAAKTILEDHDVPVVFLSSHTEPAIVEKTEKITSYGYVVKDSGETVLIASIKMAFKLYNAHKKIKEKSNQLDTLLNNAEDYIGRLDSEGRHLYVNQALCDSVGIPYEEYIGKTVTDLGYPPDLAQQWNNAIHTVCSSGKAERIEFEFPEKDGVRILDCKIVPELYEGDTVKTVVAVSRDITERKQSENDIQENEEKFHQLFNTMKEGVAIYRAADKGNDFIFVDLNNAGLSYGNKIKSNVIGRRVTEVFPGVEEIGLLDIFKRVYKTGKAEQQPLAHYQDEKMEEWVENYVFKLPSGLLVSVYEDTTKSRLNEEKYRTIVQTTTDGFWITDNQGKILEVNESYCKLSGYSREELLGLSVADIEAKERPQDIIEHINTVQAKSNDIFETRHRRKDGTIFPVEISATYFKAARQFVAFIRDISERKRQEEQLQAIADYTYDWEDWIGVDGSLLWVNPAVERITGYSPRECYRMPDYPYSLIHEDDLELSRTDIENSLRNKLSCSNREIRCRCKDGSVKWLSVSWQPIYDSADAFQGLRSSMRDITEKKETEEALQQSETQKDLILNAAKEMVAYYDTEIRIIWANRSAAESVGKSMQDLIGMHCYEVWHGRNTPCVDCPILKALENKVPFEGEQKTPDGRYWYLRGYPVLDDSKNVTALIEFGMDITARKKAEDGLIKALEEKDYLMKELNHRVKNNLALISSLINLKNASLNGAVDLSDIKHQVEAIQIVHEKLYKSSKITRINIAEYLSDLISTIFYNFSGRTIEIKRDIQPLDLPTKIVVSLGLIVNEIATNALNHGFKDTKDAVFSISMKKEDLHYVLILSNNGGEFPADIDLDNPDTLGLRLITALVQQIQGEISLVRGPHPVFTVNFPAEETKQ